MSSSRPQRRSEGQLPPPRSHLLWSGEVSVKVLEQRFLAPGSQTKNIRLPLCLSLWLLQGITTNLVA